MGKWTDSNMKGNKNKYLQTEILPFIQQISKPSKKNEKKEEVLVLGKKVLL